MPTQWRQAGHTVCRKFVRLTFEMNNAHQQGRARNATSFKPGAMGGSVQSAGGPRLKGSPGTAALVLAGIAATATAVPVKQGVDTTAKGGSTNPGELHRSQRKPVDAASPSVESLAVLEKEEAVLTVQMPLNLPLRTSWASMDTGAHNAAATARKASQAARRSHAGRVGRDAGWWGT